MTGGDFPAGAEAITLYTQDRSDIVITGTTVVPEFPIHVVLIISATVGAIIAIGRMGLLSQFYGPDFGR